MKHLTSILTLFISAGAVAQQSDSAQLYYQNGIKEIAAKRHLVAYDQFQRSIQFNPKFTAAYIQSGYEALEMRKTDWAMANFTKAENLEPGNKEAIKALTDLYFSYRQFPKAIEYAKKCADCKNSSRVIGLSLYQTEDYAEAVKSLTAALAKDPGDAEVTYTLARTYLDMEEYKKAVPYYEKAVKMDASKNVWMYELGLLYYNNNDYRNAVLTLKNAAANGYVQSNDFKENLGYASLYTEDFEQGEALLMNVWNRKPGNKDILRDLAEILYQKQQYDKSLTYCQKLMEMDAKDGKALYQAGLCFIKKGQKEKGQSMCDQAIALDPSLDGLRKKKEMVGM